MQNNTEACVVNKSRRTNDLPLPTIYIFSNWATTRTRQLDLRSPFFETGLLRLKNILNTWILFRIYLKLLFYNGSTHAICVKKPCKQVDWRDSWSLKNTPQMLLDCRCTYKMWIYCITNVRSEAFATTLTHSNSTCRPYSFVCNSKVLWSLWMPFVLLHVLIAFKS